MPARHILREGENVPLAKVFKVSCKFEAINWKRAGLSSSIEFVGKLHQQNQRPSKHTQVLWVTALNGSPGQGEENIKPKHQTVFWGKDACMHIILCS